MARARSRGSAQSWLARAGLLGFGAVIGVMLGATLDGPRLLVRRWTQEVKVLELPRPAAGAPALEQFEKLQTGQARAKPVVVATAPPAPKPATRSSAKLPDQAPSKPASPEPAPTSRPRRQDNTSQPGASTQSSASPSPEQLIAEIQERREAPASIAEGRSGPTVQVVAYRDASAAQSLVRRLRRSGYDAYLSDRRADGPNQYRVRVQPPRGSSVKTLATSLEERGYGVWITRE